MIYHLRNVRNWADFVAEVGDFSREAPRCGGATIIYGAGHQLPVFCGGLPAFSPLVRLPVRPSLRHASR